MTIREKLLTLLEEHGLFPDQASGVLTHYAESDLGEPMKGRLDDSLEGYPQQVLAAAWLGVRRSALEWIDANMPLHWARAVFADLGRITIDLETLDQLGTASLFFI
jgi:hypothetical protein